MRTSTWTQSGIGLRRLALAAVGLAALTACGLEAVLANTGKEHLQEVNVFKGAVALQNPKIVLLRSDGTTADLTESTIKGGTYVIKTAAAALDAVRVVATEGDAIITAFVPHADRQQVIELDLDASSEALYLAVVAKVSAEKTTIPSLRTAPPSTLKKFMEAMRTQMDENGAMAGLRDMIARLLAAANKASENPTPIFQDPVYSKLYAPVTSAINLAWLQAAKIDYTGDGEVDTVTAPFDIKLSTAIYETKLEFCLDPVLIRTVFAVNMNGGQKDGACHSINRFAWAKDEPGKKMFFVGGLHRESPIQDGEIDKMLGNNGSWAPNTVPMFDDGTNGDEVANDNIWTIAFALPRGARLGYKYTWGHAGDLWTGTEEWPGNQRLLEVADENGDNFAYRYDNFGDEASNKDKVNLNPLTMSSGGTVTFTSDMNKDGILDCHEQKVDKDGDCIGDEWVTPTGIGPVTVDCP